MRELSIRLFREAMGLVVGRERRKMKKQVHSSLVPLLLHLHDENKSVAQVGIPARAGGPLGRAALTPAPSNAVTGRSGLPSAEHRAEAPSLPTAALLLLPPRCGWGWRLAGRSLSHQLPPHTP